MMPKIIQADEASCGVMHGTPVHPGRVDIYQEAGIMEVEEVLKMRKIDALILAGDRQGYVPVGKRNKGRLKIQGRPLVEYVVEALAGASLVRDIYVIGPADRLAFLRESRPGGREPVIIEQREHLLANVIYAYEAICPSHREPILVCPSDIPLLRPEEADHFIRHSGYEGYDYVMGFASERALEPYYPQYRPKRRKRGMRMSYSYFKQYTGRLNNLHILNPSAALHPEYVGLIYSLRYQKRVRNFLRFMRAVMENKVNKPGLLRESLKLQAALQLDRFGMYDAAHRMGRHIDVREVEALVSSALGARFRTFCMDFGAAALDIDNRRDFETMKRRFDEWRSIAKRAEEEASCGRIFP